MSDIKFNSIDSDDLIEIYKMLDDFLKQLNDEIESLRKVIDGK